MTETMSEATPETTADQATENETQKLVVFNTFDEIVVHVLARHVYQKSDPSQEELDLIDSRLLHLKKQRSGAKFLLDVADNVVTNHGRPTIRSMFNVYGKKHKSLPSHLNLEDLLVEDERVDENTDINVIEQEGGGEGGAESCHSIIEYLGVFYKMDYSYYSYDGFRFWDTNLLRVYPRKVETIAWFSTP